MSHDRGCWKCGADSMGEKRACAAQNKNCVKASLWPATDREYANLALVIAPPLAPNLCETDPENCGCREYSYKPNAPRTIIAFTGLAGAGKSTAALHLVKNRNFQRVRFAGPLKAMMAALGLTPAQIDGDEKELPCDLLGGKTPRWAMQSIGTEWGRQLIADDLWIRAFQNSLANVPAGVPVVVDDCRFPNEAAAIVAAGGILVRIERPGAGTASVHSSEQHALPAAATLYNTLDEPNLRGQVDLLLRDFSWADRQPAA